MASKVKQTILAVAIAIVLALFVGFGINTFYASPDRDDFCQDKPQRVATEEECNATGGQWIETMEAPRPVLAENQLLCIKSPTSKENELLLSCVTKEQAQEPLGYCDVNYRCWGEYDKVREPYNRNVFIIATIAGIIAVLIGGVILKLESVSSGIMGGGVLSILYGVIRYWMDAPDILRFIILGITLAILMWVGYKKLNPTKKSGKE